MNNMNSTKILGRVGIVICLLAARSPTMMKTSQVTETAPADTREPTPLPLQATEIPQMATTVPTETQEPNPDPLSEPGPYQVGVRNYTFTDPARNGREVAISIYYPAVPPDGSTGIGFFRDASLDPRDAPYPLIAEVRTRTSKPLFYDSYRQNNITGSLILIDEGTNETVAAGMIL